jgi:hypothetical protein
VTPEDYRIRAAVPSNKDSLYKTKVIKPIKSFIDHFGNWINFLFFSCEKFIPDILATYTGVLISP